MGSQCSLDSPILIEAEEVILMITVVVRIVVRCIATVAVRLRIK
jgi:hypothetical protein